MEWEGPHRSCQYCGADQSVHHSDCDCDSRSESYRAARVETRRRDAIAAAESFLRTARKEDAARTAAARCAAIDAAKTNKDLIALAGLDARSLAFADLWLPMSAPRHPALGWYYREDGRSVSYTHLTLPTNREV